jgi:hypothetical protein
MINRPLQGNHNGLSLIKWSWHNAAVIVASFKWCNACGRPNRRSAWTMTRLLVEKIFGRPACRSSLSGRPGGFIFLVLSGSLGSFPLLVVK